MRIAVTGLPIQHADRRHRRLLRTRRERPRGGAADKRDELAPPHGLASQRRGSIPYHITIGIAALCMTAKLAAKCSDTCPLVQRPNCLLPPGADIVRESSPVRCR